MRVWLINSSEPTPLDEGEIRLLRMGVLAKYLLARGHEVFWWNADFLHAKKTHRFGEDKTVEVEPNYRIRFLHGPGYTEHISPARFWDHRIIAKKFLGQARNEATPDVVLCSLPTLDLAAVSVQYGKQFKVPVVIDIRDLWPDVIVDRIPKPLNYLAPLLLAPYYSMAKSACKHAIALTGNTPDFVDWGLKKARRERNKYDNFFPFGYEEHQLSEAESMSIDEEWRQKGLFGPVGDSGKKIPMITYIGAIAQNFQDDVIIKAALMVLKKHDVRFVFCGGGDRLAELRQKYVTESHLCFPGWVNAKFIWRLMHHADIALSAYKESSNYRSSLTNKAIEYMAGGLPILFSIDEGYVADLIRDNEIGLTYGGSPERLADAIIRLLEDEPYRKKLADNSRRLYERQYKAETVYNDFVTYLENIVKRSGADYERFGF